MSVPRFGEHRHTHLEGPRRGGPGVVDEHVQEEIGLLQPRQVLRPRPSGGEDQTPGLDPVGRSLPAQMGRTGDIAAVVQPQHAAGHAPRQPHPDVEDRWVDLGVFADPREKTAMWEFGRTRFSTLWTDVPCATSLVVCTDVDQTTAPGNEPPLSN